MGEKSKKKTVRQDIDGDYTWIRSLLDGKEAEYSADQEETLELLESRICERLHGKRLAHSMRVAKTAELMALYYGQDPFLARAAGYLHDWDKQITKEELWDKAFAYKVIPGDCDRRVEPLLHGWTAAASLPEEFPQLPPEVFQAISRHTIGAVDMTALDIIVNVADLLEPGREYKELDTIRAYVKSYSLDTVFAESLRDSIETPLLRGRYIYPVAIEVWNTWCPSLIQNLE